MQIAIIQTQTSPLVDEFAEKLEMLNLIHYASEAVDEMEFDSFEELHESVKRAMGIFITAKIPIKGNFQRVYKSYAEGITYDWKLSELAYKLVCISGSPANANVARSIIQLIIEEHINYL